MGTQLLKSKTEEQTMTYAMIVAEPETGITIDVPSGRLEAFAAVEHGGVVSVRFRNVPSFVFAEGLPVETSVGPVTADIAFGASPRKPLR
jgi:proline racemase